MAGKECHPDSFRIGADRGIRLDAAAAGGKASLLAQGE